MAQPLNLEDGLIDLALIRTSFETLTLFPEADPICAEIKSLMEDARRNFLQRLNFWQTAIEIQNVEGINYDRMRSLALDLILYGKPSRELNQMMKVDVFQEPHYWFRFLKDIPIEKARSLPASQFVARLFEDLVIATHEGLHLADKSVFEQQIFKKFLAILFLYYATRNPFFS